MSEWSAEFVREHYKRLGRPVPANILRQLGMEELPAAAQAVMESVSARVKTPKYGNIKTEVDGAMLDSRREARRWKELKLLMAAGEIAGVARQAPFRLAAKITYYADFVLLYPDGHYTVEDAKGIKTQAYNIKKKLMKERFGIEIKEV